MQAVQDFQIEENAVISGNDIGQLRESVGWEPLTEKYGKALSSSNAHFSVMHDGQLIAFVRIITDEQLYAFIVDLVVHPSAQKNGLGKALIQHAVNSLRKKNIRLIQLTFDPDLEPFYTSCGFEIIKAGSIKTY